MKIKAILVSVALGLATVGSPAAAGGKGAIERCDQSTNANRTWSLCWWLNMVSDGQPTAWLSMFRWSNR